jgi:hypothetical protein
VVAQTTAVVAANAVRASWSAVDTSTRMGN